jgi:hypothetical protein
MMICKQENMPLWNTNPQHQNALHDTQIETWKKTLENQHLSVGSSYKPKNVIWSYI